MKVKKTCELLKVAPTLNSTKIVGYKQGAKEP